MATIDVPLATAVTPLARLARLLRSQQKLCAVVKSAAQVFAIRLLGAGLTYASMVLLARWLGSHNFGIYAYVFVIVTLLGLAFSFGLGVALTGTVDGGLTGLLWGGAARIFLVHHSTFSINSVCHFFGRRRFDVEDRSTNVAWLALPSLGESWHHNHHAFPRSAYHGLRWYELDLSALVIRALAALGLAREVVTADAEAQRQRADAEAQRQRRAVLPPFVADE